MKLDKQCRNMKMRGCLKEPLGNGCCVTSGNCLLCARFICVPGTVMAPPVWSLSGSSE